MTGLLRAVGAVAVGGLLFVGCGGETEAPLASPPAWGEPDLTGVWRGARLGAREGMDTFKLTELERLYQPEARAKMKEMSDKDDPTLRCAPPAFPRAAMLGQPFQIIQSPGFAFVFTEAYPVSRVIPTTGRPHTSSKFLFPTFMGDSTARWEGDTLIVEVISFNGENWLAGGQDRPTTASTGVWPTSDAMRVVERWRRVDADTLEYQARVEDPRMLTGAWDTPTIVMKRLPDEKIQEVLCLLDDDPSSYLEQFGR